MNHDSIDRSPTRGMAAQDFDFALAMLMDAVVQNIAPKSMQAFLCVHGVAVIAAVCRGLEWCWDDSKCRHMSAI